MKIRSWLNKRWVKLVLEVLFFILLYLVLRAYMQRDMAHGMAPPIQAMTLTQQSFQLSAARKPVLVHFWATWCGICKLEQDSIQSIGKDYSLITIAIQSGDDQDVQTYLTEQHLDFPVINDTTGDIAAQYGVVGVPASFIVDPAGDIVAAERGFTTEWGLRLRLWWAGL